MTTFKLNNRTVIKVSGEDRLTFLQGLVTNDVLNKNDIVYALMLNPQGRFLYDFFIFYHNEYLLLDCQASKIDEIVKKLNMYKLRSNVVIENVSDQYQILASFQTATSFLPDPRSQEIGYRACVSNNYDSSNDLEEYELKRISLLIPDADKDLFFDKSFPLQYGMDKFNAIDFEKGCYVGQEVTARTHHRGVVRKEVQIKVLAPNTKVEKGDPIMVDNKKIGILLGSQLNLNEEKLYCLSLVQKEESININ